MFPKPSAKPARGPGTFQHATTGPNHWRNRENKWKINKPKSVWSVWWFINIKICQVSIFGSPICMIREYITCKWLFEGASRCRGGLVKQTIKHHQTKCWHWRQCILMRSSSSAGVARSEFLEFVKTSSILLIHCIMHLFNNTTFHFARYYCMHSCKHV